MTNGYVVTFYPGASGRFISGIIFRMKNDVSTTLELTKENSAHNDIIFTDSGLSDVNKIKFPSMGHSIEVNQFHKGLFKYVNFLPADNTNVLYSHEPISFSEWKTNINKDSFKTIIITLDEESLLEVCGNTVIKNTVSILKKPFEKLTRRERHHFLTTKKTWESHFKRPRTVEVFDEPIFFKESVKRLTYNNRTKNFIDVKIPQEFKDKVLELKYKELFIKDQQGNFITLLKLSEWLNAPITENIVAEYEKYAQGRIDLIQTKMPWLNNSS